MIEKKKFMRVLACSAVLAAAWAHPANAQSATGAQPAAASPSSASSAAAAEATPTVRPEIGNLLIDAQRLLGEKNNSEAAGKILAAEAVADKTPYEQHILARVKGALATAMGDADLAVQQYELASQGPWLKQADKTARLQAIVALYYNAKNYAKAIEWIEKYQQAGGADAAMKAVLAQSYYLKGDYASAAKALEVLVGDATAAGRVPDEMQLKLLADSRSRLRDEAGYARALESMVKYYPTQANWRSLISRLWAKPQLAARLQMDVFRLQMATAGLADESDYTEMAALALQEGSAIEASKVLEQGYAAGVLVAGDKSGELQRLTDKAGKSAAEDRNTLEKDVARARTLPDGLALFNYGFNMFQLGQAERALALMEQGLAKGIARNGDLARLRLVAVYAKLNQPEKAAEQLALLAGRTELIGLDDCVRYWKLFLRRP
ncbi:MAG: tetratricopeptide repeat protein [Rhodoferax sp.]